MKLILPESEVKLYETGFEEGDLLDRKRFSQRLSELVDNIEDPCVIAVDGAWGSGKSYFLRRWVGAHAKENSGKALTVYFDAFEHDFLDDPLIGLVGVMAERFETGASDKKGIWKAGKKIVAKIWRPTLRIGAALATSGISEFTGPAVDGILAGVQAEVDKSSEEFWKREDGKRAAIAEFRSFLANLTAPKDDAGLSRIVVVVDELDRCRPDYALALLETIKHFFSVPNVHFVLGVNLTELENIVKSRYGIQTAARDYIRKFVTIKIQLPDTTANPASGKDWQVFFNESYKKMGLEASVCQEISSQLSSVHSESLSLRTMQRLLSEVAVLPKLNSKFLALPYLRVACSLLLLKFFNPLSFERAKNGTLRLEDLTAVFDFKTYEDRATQERIDRVRFYAIWCLILKAPELEALDPKTVSEARQAFSYMSDLSDLRQLIREHLEFADLDMR